MQELGEGSVGLVGQVDGAFGASVLGDEGVALHVDHIQELGDFVDFVGVLWFMILPMISENLLGLGHVLF